MGEKTGAFCSLKVKTLFTTPEKTIYEKESSLTIISITDKYDVRIIAKKSEPYQQAAQAWLTHKAITADVS